MQGFSLVVVSGGYSPGVVHWLLIAEASLVEEHGSRQAGVSSCGSQALEHRLNSCDAQTSVLRSMCSPPRPGIEPMSPALADRFFSIDPPLKPPNFL